MKYNLIYFDDQIQNIDAYKILLSEHFDIVGCTDSTKYDQVLENCRPHAILIDFHMPIIDGISLQQKIVESENYNGCPIFFISGDYSDEARIMSHRSGAIDFLTRDLSEAELILRMTSKIRLYLQGALSLELGNLKLNMEKYSITVRNKPVDLTLVEMRILCVLMRSIPEPVTKKELLEKIWGDSTEGKIHVHLSNLGTKLKLWTHEIKARGDSIFIEAV